MGWVKLIIAQATQRMNWEMFANLVFGTATTIGVLYAILSPSFRKRSIRISLGRIILQELSTNEQKFEHVIGTTDRLNNRKFFYEINISMDQWEIFHEQICQVFHPSVYILLMQYYGDIQRLINETARLKGMSSRTLEMDVEEKGVYEHDVSGYYWEIEDLMRRLRDIRYAIAHNNYDRREKANQRKERRENICTERKKHKEEVALYRKFPILTKLVGKEPTNKKKKTSSS